MQYQVSPRNRHRRRCLMQAVLDSLTAARRAHEAATSGRPFVLLTWAQSLDGFIAAAPGARTHLSNSATSLLTHNLRAAHDAILVGVDTVRADDPRLTARIPDNPNAPSPAPVVLDSLLRMPLSAKLLHSRPLIFTSVDRANDPNQVAAHVSAGASVLGAADAAHGLGRCLHTVLRELRRRNLNSVMVEGGARILASFAQERLADFVIITIAPVFLGDGVRLSVGGRSQGSKAGDARFVPHLQKPTWTKFDDDMVISGVPTYLDVVSMSDERSFR